MSNTKELRRIIVDSLYNDDPDHIEAMKLLDAVDAQLEGLTRQCITESTIVGRLDKRCDELEALVRVAKCPNCDGSGVIVIETTGIEPGCCGRPNRDGSCCGNAIPVQTQEQEQQQCQWCDSRQSLLHSSEGKP